MLDSHSLASYSPIHEHLKKSPLANKKEEEEEEKGRIRKCEEG